MDGMDGGDGGDSAGHAGMPHMGSNDTAASPDNSTAGTANQGAGMHNMPDHNVGVAHQMSPFLFTRTTGFFVLFKEADIQSSGAFAGAFLLSFAFALLATTSSQLIRYLEERALTKGGTVSKFLAGLHHAVRLLLHYAAMLIVMTMNVWIILAVVIGHAFGWMLYAFVLHPRLRTPSTKPACDC